MVSSTDVMTSLLEGRFGTLFGNPAFCYVFWHRSHATIKNHTVEYGEATAEFGFHWTTRKGEQPEAPRCAWELLWGSFKIHCLSGPHSSQQMGLSSKSRMLCVCVTQEHACHQYPCALLVQPFSRSRGVGQFLLLMDETMVWASRQKTLLQFQPEYKG